MRGSRRARSAFSRIRRGGFNTPPFDDDIIVDFTTISVLASLSVVGLCFPGNNDVATREPAATAKGNAGELSFRRNESANKEKSSFHRARTSRKRMGRIEVGIAALPFILHFQQSGTSRGGERKKVNLYLQSKRFAEAELRTRLLLLQRASTTISSSQVYSWNTHHRRRRRRPRERCSARFCGEIYSIENIGHDSGVGINWQKWAASLPRVALAADAPRATVVSGSPDDRQRR